MIHQEAATKFHGQRVILGRGWAKRYNYAWITSIGIYRLCGTVRYR